MNNLFLRQLKLSAPTSARLAAICLGALSVGLPAQAANVEVKGFQLLVDGKKMAIKGVNYSPVPTGSRPMDPPYGDYFVNGYSNVWRYDLQKMREAGVNCIKLYAGNPALNAGGPNSGGNWKQFLDACWNGGDKPIYVVMFSYLEQASIIKGGADLQRYINDYDSMVRSTVNQPAVLGYCIGNEIFDGVENNDTFWTNYGKIVDVAAKATKDMNSSTLLMTAIVDNYTPEKAWSIIVAGEKSHKLKHLNAWGINSYRGKDFGNDAGNKTGAIFAQYKRMMDDLGIKKPMIASEWGTAYSTRGPDVYGKDAKPSDPALNLDQIPADQMGQGKTYFDATPVPEFLSFGWATMKANIGAGADQVCVGGFIFYWSDEYWKANDPNNHVGGPNNNFQSAAMAGGYHDQAWFGLMQSVPASSYGANKPPISRVANKGYDAVKNFYNTVNATALGSELYRE